MPQQPHFTVVEYSSFFAVRHNPSGDEHPIGDGVDTLFDDEGHSLYPGTPGFIETLQEVLNADADSTIETYFPQHISDAI